ncbi:5-carboxymethyl-2-hydroxymuconate isomerase [Colletotrichum cuscutae]|uniref:5-carboxymethyl-2-hydroxymuconate isomerase n=1 Tax=Colletotrichum cuscutae TaxID=1209917 RepID=A0AAI9V9F5_9PEZI|nr:5-carboxymethyl-2-hydroxymuconate isomerase [Colletotrichum cuscutae]
MSWNRLIRFVDDNDVEHFGEPEVQDEPEITSLLEKSERVHVKALRPLLTPKDVPIIRCIGLNYVKHIKEGGRTPPPFPSLFIKPATSVAAWNEDVPIPKVAQDGTVDYEVELAIVIGKSGKNIPKENALEYVAGYLTANDVSARAWQRDPAKAGGVPQWCFSKGFDKFAPFSPVLVSPAVAGNASDLLLQTFVNGEERQHESTGDLLFGVEEIVSFLSQGTTLEAGTVVLTGTPSGVAMGMKPPKYLNDGDVVEVRISKLGSVKNKMVFE